ncbi:hypothetical protein HJC22_29910 [Corallococcus exiguus]|uniref:hypothetical protein n=1 Tax=Corallococcus TaxID=83461 RepID=UPI000ED02688|nr:MULTISPECIES: hypothetical protein [Corallococcus]NNC19941.1 hypothetical protein [Corallococcus exiguus]NRD57650.1 hypothetical protein [Corallococcus exiguus]RKI06248.1 hypothetical protein D7Y15_31320 [Corallococcus sp. AB030]
MFAVIHRSAAAPGAGFLSVAGPPLVTRQLQWLRASGFEKVAIDIGADAHGAELRSLVSQQEALARNVIFVPTASLFPPGVIADSAGFPAHAPFLVVPDTVLGNADLAAFYRRAPERGVRVGRLAPPPAVEPFAPAEVHLITAATGPVTEEELPGWGARLETPGAVLRLACKALLGRLPRAEGTSRLLIHAAERAPGVWVARGALLQRGAEVNPPVLIGPQALVCAGARIGPGALIGARAIIERGTRLVNAVVEEETVVGEGLEVRDAIATPDGLASLEGTGPLLPLGDPLLLARRRLLSRAALRLLGLSR